jgi:hypothetical protein
MINRDFGQYDLIIHESGIPPIHTPLHILNKLSDEIKDKIRLYHVAKNDVENFTECNLKRIVVGLKHTIVLIKQLSEKTEE